ncbi:hypothetical protein [Cohnella rhizosphaerae]|uniref:Uncharacterized protein n=1 Tax=Cohnella rhizosphaerae TaxID=1457232 RepID=A0A9X4KYU2_9BACL|nr:hypothetical protein [Cohnella rhizosphaerae]MDG0812896.1 hypothetical protein [Cohnella rhizosphaerae]
MNVTIREASMTKDEVNGYVGKVVFEVEGHDAAYEMALQSDKGREWSYSLLFAGKSGSEAQIDAVDAEIESNDELYERLVDAAVDALD